MDKTTPRPTYRNFLNLDIISRESKEGFDRLMLKRDIKASVSSEMQTLASLASS